MAKPPTHPNAICALTGCRRLSLLVPSLPNCRIADKLFFAIDLEEDAMRDNDTHPGLAAASRRSRGTPRARAFAMGLFASCIALAWPMHAIAQATGQPPPPSAMSRQELESEVTRLRAYVRRGAVLPRRSPGCLAPENRQFDFWVGEWDVTRTANGDVVAESTIELIDQGCAINEHWRPFRSAHGDSLSIYDAGDRRWHQTYVDATGRRTEMSGGLDPQGVMRFDLPPGGASTRMSYQRLDGNSVRQWGDHRDTNGNWVVDFDFTYRKRGTIPAG
jgi:hypothetical protein